jgi:hypothetical protein
VGEAVDSVEVEDFGEVDSVEEDLVVDSGEVVLVADIEEVDLELVRHLEEQELPE